jgi:hypothetical protein
LRFGSLFFNPAQNSDVVASGSVDDDRDLIQLLDDFVFLIRG